MANVTLFNAQYRKLKVGQYILRYGNLHHLDKAIHDRDITFDFWGQGGMPCRF